MTQPDSVPQFLASEIPDLPSDQCRFHVIPAPYEHTVSYGGGTANGPQAIIEASYQLEAYDGFSCPCNEGIYTHQPAKGLSSIEATVCQALDQHAIPVVLGGEHTVTYGALKALKESGEEFGIVQFDAHADLRDSYEGDKFSHACVMRRALDLKIPLFQIGVRALSVSEVELRKEYDIPHLDARELALNGIPDQLLPDDFPQKVYISFDVDGLDSSIMPATGTPEPGGLGWYQTMTCLEKVTASRRVIGFDVVEFSPIKNLHAPDFTAARLVYNIMGMIARSGGQKAEG